MRKFLMAAAVLAVAACTEKAPEPAGDSVPPAAVEVAPAPAPATTDSGAVKADSGAKPDTTHKM